MARLATFSASLLESRRQQPSPRLPAEIVQNTAAAQVRALAELGPIAGPAAAAKIALFGKLQAGLVAASGLAQASSAGGGGSRGGGGAGLSSIPAQGGGGGGKPVEYRVYGIDRDAQYSGAFWEKIWSGLFEEGKRRGVGGPNVQFMGG
jgi:hypothetical protein